MKISRFVALLATALLASLALPGAAQAASTTYYADSGDQCAYGVSRGTVDWRVGGTPATAHAAIVNGTLVDRPTPTDPFLCRDDGRFSVVNFVAYNDNVAVDRDARRADNGVVQFSIVLGDNISPTLPRIDFVVIQVCRHTSSSVAPIYCGPRVLVDAP